jgi:hypothetical protein
MPHRELGIPIQHLLSGKKEITVHVSVQFAKGKDDWLPTSPAEYVKEPHKDPRFTDSKGISITFRETGDAVVKRFAGFGPGEFGADYWHETEQVAPGLTPEKALTVLLDAALHPEQGLAELDFREENVLASKERLTKIAPRLAGLIT